MAMEWLPWKKKAPEQPKDDPAAEAAKTEEGREAVRKINSIQPGSLDALYGKPLSGTPLPRPDTISKETAELIPPKTSIIGGSIDKF